jgi:hypothetical protein
MKVILNAAASRDASQNLTLRVAGTMYYSFPLKGGPLDCGHERPEGQRLDRTGFGQSLDSARRAARSNERFRCACAAGPVLWTKRTMKNTTPYKTIIRFEQAAEQVDGPIKRVVGFVPARSMLSLFDDATLDANPRSAKANSVVADIIDSVRDDPKIFQFKTKGILLGTSDFTELERKR